MTLLLVDDHALVRAGIRRVLLQAYPDAEIVEAGSAREALAAFMARRWDVVLLDIDLPDRDGLDLLRDFKLAMPQVPVLMLSGQSEGEYGVRALRSGAAGFISKTERAEVFAAAVGKVREGGRHVSPALADQLAQALAPGGLQAPHERLSAREFQIFIALASGRSVGEIATQLSLSVKTVSTYRMRLLQKMALATNGELMRYALQHRLVK